MILNFVLIVLTLAITFYVALAPVVTSGLELLFLLPLTLASCLLFFKREFSYSKTSLGLTILYSTILVRYLVTPLLMSVSQQVVDSITAGASDYRFALFVQVYELYVVMFCVKFIWPKHHYKKNILKRNINFSNYSFRFSKLGFLLFLALVFLLFGRGHWGNILSHLSTWFHRDVNSDVLYTNDLIAFDVIKVVLFVLIVTFAKKMYIKTSLKKLSILIAILGGILNTMYYLYSARTDLLMLFILSLIVLKYTFPQSKQFFYFLFGLGGVSFVVLVFLEGTMHYEVGSSIGSIQLGEFAKMAQLYTTGPSIVANAHMNYEIVSSRMDGLTYIKDLNTAFSFLSVIPFFRFIGDAASSGFSTIELYVQSLGGLAYIIPNYSLVSLYFGQIAGFLFHILVVFYTIKLIAFIERNLIKYTDLLYLYANFYIVVMFSMGIFVNNFILMFHSATNIPIWLLLFAIANKWGRSLSFKNSGSFKSLNMKSR